MPNHSINDTHKGGISIYLDSKYADVKQNGDDNSNCIFYMDNHLDVPADSNLMLGLVTASIPMSFYNIDNSNNFLKLNGSINGTTTINLPSKSYTSETLVNAINQVLTANGNNIVMSFDNESYKFKFSSLTQNIQILDTTMHIQLGIPKNTIFPTTASQTYESPILINLGGHSQICVGVNNVSLVSMDSRLGGDLNGVLGKINVGNYGFGEYIDYQASENRFYMVQDRVITHWNISLTNESLELINFNSQHWTIEICCHWSKKRTPTLGEDFVLNKSLAIQQPLENPKKKKAKSSKKK